MDRRDDLRSMGRGGPCHRTLDGGIENTSRERKKSHMYVCKAGCSGHTSSRLAENRLAENRPAENRSGEQ